MKWLDGDDVDASLIACFTPFELFPADGDIASATVSAIERRIAHHGVHRYAADTFYGGGEWPLLAALLGWHYARTGRTEEAWRQFAWVVAQADEDGELPEQSTAHLLHPVRHQEWVDRWGPIASPLLWSHAMFLILAAELGVTGHGPPDAPRTGTDSAPALPAVHPAGAAHDRPAAGPHAPVPLEKAGQLRMINRFSASSHAAAERPPASGRGAGWHSLHCTMLGFDISRFGESGRDDEVQLYVRSSMYEILSRLFDDIGVGWQRCHHEDRGDGVLVVVDPQVPSSHLIAPLILPLRAELRHHNKMSSDTAQIRLRMAMHAGPTSFDANGVSGRAVIHLFRLLDSSALRDALAEAPGDLAFAASDHLYSTMIKPAGGLIDPDSYRAINVAHKESRARAWLLTL